MRVCAQNPASLTNSPHYVQVAGSTSVSTGGLPGARRLALSLSARSPHTASTRSSRTVDKRRPTATPRNHLPPPCTVDKVSKLHFELAREYDDGAAEYDRKWKTYTDATVAFALKELPPLPPGARVLDLACGTGAILRALDATAAAGDGDGGVGVTGGGAAQQQQQALRLAEYVGLDNSAAMLEKAASSCGACSSATTTRWLHAPADQPLPLPDASFDAVVTANSFHFFGDRKTSLRESARVLKPGGFFLIADWSADYLTCQLLELWLRLVGRPTAPVLRAAQLRALVEATPGLVVVRESSSLLLKWWGFMCLLARKE